MGGQPSVRSHSLLAGHRVTLLGNAGLVQHDVTVGIPDGGQSVSDGQRRASARKLRWRRLDRPLGLHVLGAGRLVEDEDRLVVQESPRGSKTQLLVACSFRVALADLCMRSVRHNGVELLDCIDDPDAPPRSDVPAGRLPRNHVVQVYSLAGNLILKPEES